MAFVQVNTISQSYGDRTILSDVSLSIDGRSRIALAGDNGSGKSTLLKIIAGLLAADSGTIAKQRDTQIAYLPQWGVTHSGKDLMTEVEEAFAEGRRLEREKGEIEEGLAEVKTHSTETSRLLDRHHIIEETLMSSGYYDRQHQIRRVLTGLRFPEENLHKNTEEFSGGWQMRIALSKILLAQPDILLLDEPTNYLDLEARTWLEKFLTEFSGGVIVVSHDRFFLDVTVSSVVELFNGKLTQYRGNYSQYEAKREAELESLIKQYEKQQEEIAKTEDFIQRFRYNASKATLVQSRVRQLEKINRVELPASMKRLHFEFPKAPRSGQRVVRIDNLSRQYGNNHVLNDITIDIEKGEKLFISGVNGAGKSTLMRIISGKDQNYTGEMAYGAGVQCGYFSQEQDSLLDSHTVFEEAEENAPTSLFPLLRKMLGAFLFRGDDIYKQVAVLSGGERSRLALLKLLLHQFNLLVLDEPTNHLDMISKAALLDALKAYAGTLVFVSHDRFFIEALANRVLELKNGKWRVFPGDYVYYRRRIEQEQETSSMIPLSSDTKQRVRTKNTRSILRKLAEQEEEIVKQIEELEREQHKLAEEMAKPAVYIDGKKVKEIKHSIEKNRGKQELMATHWQKIEQERKELEIDS